jgi:hypothetical protein
MKRRDALKSLALASGGLLTLPSWAIRWKPEDIPPYSDYYTELELRLISSITDTIIPSNGTIGALSVGVDVFLSGLIARCYDKEFGDGIKAKLKVVDMSARRVHGKSFTECTQAQREQLLTTMEQSDEDDREFFGFMKSQTIRGFETSEEVTVDYHDYVLMPGFYDGNVDVEVS